MKNGKKIYRVGDPNPRHPEKKLLTRRDFISAGIGGMTTGGIVLPTVLDLLLSEKARADGTCPTNGGALPCMIPFIIFDCAGGCSLPGNWVIGGKETRPADGSASFAVAASKSSSPTAGTDAFSAGFTPLTDPSIGGNYSDLGLMGAPGAAAGFYNADFRYGAPMAAPLDMTPNGVAPTQGTANIQSQIFTTMNAIISDGTDKTYTKSVPSSTIFDIAPKPNGTPNFQANLRMGTMAHNSLSDSGTNMLSAVTMVTSAGSLGNSIRNGLGNGRGNSAGNSDVANLNGAYRPMAIQSVNNLTSALSYGPAFSNLSPTVKTAVSTALNNLSGTQAQNFASMNLGQQLGALASAGYIKNKAYTGNTPALNAATDPTGNAQKVFTGTFSPGLNDANENLIATLMLAALTGASGPAVITIGGCDYHSGQRTDGDMKDTEIGTRIGQAVQLAGLLGVPFAFHVLTDGGIYSDPGSRNWRGDDNNKSLSVFGIYDPTGPRDMVSTQINTYTAGQGANLNHFIGSDPQMVASAVFLNYLAVTGQRSQFPNLVNSTANFTAATLNSLLLFKDKS